MAIESKRWQKPLKVIRYATVEFALLSVIVGIWVASYRATLRMELPTGNLDTLMALLFGAASIAIFVISLVIGILAIIGWQSLRELIKDKVEIAVSKNIEYSSKEQVGRNLTTLGFITGELSINPDDLKLQNPERMEYSIFYLRKAVEILEAINSDQQWSARNNLVYYATVRGHESDRSMILGQAGILLDKGTSLGRPHYVLTYCRAILDCSDDEKARTRVRALLGDLLRGGLGEKEKKEASIYLASYFPSTTGSGVNLPR